MIIKSPVHSDEAFFLLPIYIPLTNLLEKLMGKQHIFILALQKGKIILHNNCYWSLSFLGLLI